MHREIFREADNAVQSFITKVDAVLSRRKKAAEYNLAEIEAAIHQTKKRHARLKDDFPSLLSGMRREIESIGEQTALEIQSVYKTFAEECEEKEKELDAYWKKIFHPEDVRKNIIDIINELNSRLEIQQRRIIAKGNSLFRDVIIKYNNKFQTAFEETAVEFPLDIHLETENFHPPLVATLSGLAAGAAGAGAALATGAATTVTSSVNWLPLGVAKLLGLTTTVIVPGVLSASAALPAIFVGVSLRNVLKTKGYLDNFRKVREKIPKSAEKISERIKEQYRDFANKSWSDYQVTFEETLKRDQDELDRLRKTLQEKKRPAESEEQERWLRGLKEQLEQLKNMPS